MIGCVNWALANENQTLQNNATNISTSSCDIILQPTCNLTATEINNGTQQHPNRVGSQLLTIFLLVIFPVTQYIVFYFNAVFQRRFVHLYTLYQQEVLCIFI